MPLQGRTPNKQEKQWMDDIVNFVGCIVCRLHRGIVNDYCSPHHMEGKTKKGAHRRTIPLCDKHHQIPSNNGEWISRHGDGKAAFEEEYGSEEFLLTATEEILKKEKSMRTI